MPKLIKKYQTGGSTFKDGLSFEDWMKSQGMSIGNYTTISDSANYQSKVLDKYDNIKKMNSLFTKKTDLSSIIPKTQDSLFGKDTLNFMNKDVNSLVPNIKGLSSSSIIPKSGGVGSFLKGNSATIGAIGGVALDMVSSFLPKLDHQNTANAVLDIGSQVAGFIPGPAGIATSLALKGINVLDQATGKKANKQGTLGETAKGYNLDFNTNANTSYGGLFGNKSRRQANRLTNKYESSNLNKLATSYSSTQDEIANQNSIQDILTKNFQNLRGGTNINILSAKKGIRIDYLPQVKKILNNRKSNVIPGGALHKELNHLDLDVTNKGIPVVTMEDGGEVKDQHAEIEREEVILNLNLTKKLEELYKKYEEDPKDEYAIEAGKLLSSEIIENTQDNTGLLNTIE